MALVFHRGLAVPLLAIALCAAALPSSSRLLPSFTALLVVALMTSLMMVMVRWLGTRHPKVAVFPAAGRHRATDDALDLVRMDDDGGWHMPLEHERGLHDAL